MQTKIYCMYNTTDAYPFHSTLNKPRALPNHTTPQPGSRERLQPFDTSDHLPKLKLYPPPSCWSNLNISVLSPNLPRTLLPMSLSLAIISSFSFSCCSSILRGRVRRALRAVVASGDVLETRVRMSL